jgi:hypothetical protein
MLAADGELTPERFRVRVDGGRFGPVLANLALARAQARAAVLDGHRVEIASIDGTVVAVERAGDRSVVTPPMTAHAMVASRRIFCFISSSCLLGRTPTSRARRLR